MQQAQLHDHSGMSRLRRTQYPDAHLGITRSRCTYSQTNIRHQQAIDSFVLKLAIIKPFFTEEETWV